MTAAPSPTAVRLSVFYAATFLVIGVHMPFWPVWLKAHGLGVTEIGIVLAIGVAAKVLGNPIAAHIADRRGERRRPMIVHALLAVLSFALFAQAEGFWPVVAVSLLFFLVWPPLLPLSESLTMLAVRRDGLDYGRIRLWGSIAFILGAVGAGQVLARSSPEVVFPLVLAALGGVCVAALLLPDLRPPLARPARAPILYVLRGRGFALFLAATAAVQASHAVYYGFATLHWQAAGYGDTLIGGLWALGVIAEILLFAAGDRVVRRAGAAWLIVIGGLAGGLRWTVTGTTTELWALVIVQTLHALSFGAVHLGAIHFIARAVPPELSATAQSLYSSVVMGLGLGLMLFAAGPLYAAVGAHAFHAMALSAVLGAGLALRLRRSLPDAAGDGPSAEG